VDDYIWPLLIIVAESVLLLVLLLIVTAYVLYADRKIWAAVQIRRGPNVVGPWGLLQSFADLLKFIVKEPIIPAGANKGVFLLAPLVTAVLALSAWAVIPVNAEWVIADLNIGVLYIFAISSLMVYGVIMAGWSSTPNIRSSHRCARRRRWSLRSLHRLRHHHRPAMCGIAQSVRDRRRAGRQLGNVELVLAAAVPDVRDLLHLGTRGNQPAALRPGGGRIRAGRGLRGGIFGDAVPAVLPRRIHRHSHDVRDGDHPVSRRLAAAVPGRAIHLGPGLIWFALKCLFMFFMFAMVKAIVPRYRYDQLMRLGWKVFLPLSLAMVAIVAGVLQYWALVQR
jgi:NADH-quinone oxidoreductase subunit H